MTFLVTTREVHKQVIEIEADNEAQATERVLEGEGDSEQHASEYDYTLDADEWSVEAAPALAKGATMSASWERTIRGDKGEFCISVHVDSEGYPVVTVIPHPEDGFSTVVSDISHDGVEHALAAGKNANNPVAGQLQTTFGPSA